MKTLRKLADWYGLGGLWVFLIVFSMTFYTAYFGDYKVLVDINSVGEAHIEAVMIPIFIALGLYHTRNHLKVKGAGEQ
jgi:hypothetical protein